MTKKLGKKLKGLSKGLKKTGTFKGKSNKLGGGGRFAQVEAKAAASGASNPAAVAAAAGRKSLGNKKFQALAVAGRKRANAKKKSTSPVRPAVSKRMKKKMGFKGGY